jgi:enterochelin esterase-like enzyme
MRTIATLLAVLISGGVQAQAPASQLPQAPPATRPTPPTRAVDGPGAPAFTKIPNGNAPADKEGNFVIGPDYAAPPELTVKDGVPVGKVTQFTLDSKDSRYYPGIARDVFGTPDPDNPKALIVETHPQEYQRTITVYVPAQYRKGKKAPLIVTHDGPKMGEPDLTLPHILDHLIAAKRVPALVVVMIQNGGGDAQGSERGLEYDTLSGKFAEFIQAEVLPQVQKHYGLRLTRNPDGRAVMGCSSGAAAAFTMAWFRPDLYHRILTYSGTFVNLRNGPEAPLGAYEYIEHLFPSGEKKPFRLWIQVSENDNGSKTPSEGRRNWVIANSRLAKVLKEKGYAYQFVYSKGAGHTQRKVIDNSLPQALEYVWLGYTPQR